VGKVGNGLKRPLKKYFLYFIEQQGKTYGGYKPQRGVYNAHGNGIPYCYQESLVRKEELKPFQPHPLLFEKTILRSVSLERHCPAPKGNIDKKYDIENYGKAHEKYLTLTA
jgi:hypothetical protein